MDTEYTKGFLAGMTWSEERIIKLLKQEVVLSNLWLMFDRNLEPYGNLQNYVIALIKGEQK